LRASGVVALAAAAVSFALLAAAALLAARQAARDLGILHALGHPSRRIGAVVLGEGLLVGSCGALLGAGLALAVIDRLALAVSTESVSVLVEPQPLIVVGVVLLSLLLALLAGLPAAWRAMRSGPRQVLEGG
ncbi:MAG: FtsX-like permease family protein, partial [Planctomycetota bacterium]